MRFFVIIVYLYLTEKGYDIEISYDLDALYQRQHGERDHAE
jgi:hypothetical protein